MKFETKLKRLNYFILSLIPVIVIIFLIFLLVNPQIITPANRMFVFPLEMTIILMIVGILSFTLIYRFYFLPFLTEEGDIYLEDLELDENKKLEALQYQLQSKGSIEPWKSRPPLKEKYTGIILLTCSIGAYAFTGLFFINPTIIIYLLTIIIVLLLGSTFLLLYSISKLLPRLIITTNGIEYRKRSFLLSYQKASWDSIEKHELKKRVRKYQNETEETLIINIYFKQGDKLELTDEDIIGFKGFISLIKEKLG